MSTYNETRFLNLASEVGILREETIAWMDHLSAVLDSNLNDLITGQVSPDRSVLAALANDVCFIGLCDKCVSSDKRRGS
jgi:hypothetical protein